jgi:NADH-quinone oxidoreductase subunit J
MLLWMLLGLMVLLSIGCCVFKDLLYVAVSLATISGVLALVLFLFGANIAGVFELSVCAGLITVLFIATVSLTKDSDQKVETRLPAYFVPLVILIFVGIDYFIIQWVTHSLPASVVPRPSGTFQRVFWELRSADMLGQIGLIGAGVFGILALFRVTAKEKKHE